jgi:hypothetical protein
MNKKQVVFSMLLLATVLLGCKMTKETTSTPSANTNSAAEKSSPSTTKVNDDGTIASGTGVEKEKPAPGKGNVQGKVLYNEKPVPDIEVKLCETFNRFLGGCGGETFITKTDQNGEYVIKNVNPRIYEGLLVKVFNSNYYVFATSGFVGTAKYKIDPDKTFFAADTNLFKDDLRVTSPKASAKVAADNIEFKWDPYPDATFYKLSVYADTESGAKPEYDFIGRKVEGESFITDKPLTPGTYNLKLEAFNANEVKLAESSSDHKITVSGK